MNTGKLAGRTLFITGASRGIGLAIALKAAKDGANVVIAAKTADPNPKLPGTIFTAAKEIEQAGGKALPLTVDIRFEDQVQSAVEQAVRKFGGIDILVNNASAIHLTGTLDTPMKRYDLMHQINARGTFMVSQKCIPYLKQSKNGHILTLSPPLNMNPHWFKNHVAYTMAKYGMSMCVLGMAEELKSVGIAVNALWPRTAVWTAAMAMLGGGSDAIAKECRKPEIMADAAYVVLTRDAKSYTGNFYIDDEVLKEVGVTNFDKYAIEPGHPLLPDAFLGDPEQIGLGVFSPASQQRAARQDRSSSARKAMAQDDAKERTEGGDGAVAAVFAKVKALLSEGLVKQVDGVFTFDLSGSDSGKWHLDLKNAGGAVGSGDPSSKADVEFAMDSADCVRMFRGELKPTVAFMSGKLKIKGNMATAMKLEKVLGELKSKL